MKHKLTYAYNYILVVDDSEIKDGDWMHRNDEQPTFVTSNFWWDFKDRYRKIIAHLPLNNSPILKGVDLLPPMVIEKGKDDFIEYIKQKHNQERCVGFMDGWNKHAEKYKYSEEDMIRMAIHCWNIASRPTYGATYNVNEITEEYIQSLSQPKMPTHFECETEWINSYGSPTFQYDVQELNPKTTTNSQGQVLWVGKWIYE